MPSKKTVFATEEERAAAEKKQADDRAAEIDKHNKYPSRFLKKLGSDELLNKLTVDHDTRPFFASGYKRRICVSTGDYLLPLVPDDGCDRNTLHMHSFELGTKFLTDDVMAKLGGDNLAVLASLGKGSRLEMDSGLPHMAAGEGYTRQRPVINPEKTENAYTPKEVILRYLPSLVSGEKNILFNGSMDAVYSAFLFNGRLTSLPEHGTHAAHEFWEANVKNKLFMHCDEKVDMHTHSTLPKSRETGNETSTFAIFYTICMPDVQHTVDHFTCQGRRMLQQADLRLMNAWMDLTRRLVGEDYIPGVAIKYCDALKEKKANIAKFDELVLSPLAENVCKDTWESLKEKETESTNSKGHVCFELSMAQAKVVVDGWKGKEFGNPSIDVLGADGTKKAQLIFNSAEADKAMLGEMFTRADYRDAEEYTAAVFGKNLSKMSNVFKTLSYVLADKEPPMAVVVHDSEEADGAPKRGRKRKAAAAAQPASAAASSSGNLLTYEQFMQFAESWDAFIVEQRRHNAQQEEEQAKEAKRAMKLRKFVYANLPVLPEEEEGEEGN